MITALVLSGGTGARMGGDIPKQYREVNGRTVLSYCIERLYTHPGIDAIRIVAARDWRDQIVEWLHREGWDEKFAGFSEPGENRQLSIFNGLTDIRVHGHEDDYVFIHDAARPLLTEQLISACLQAVTGHDGVLPVLRMKDTVYESRDGRTITSLLERSSLFAGQAPEVFRLGSYYEANKRLLPDAILKINGSTEPAVMAGLDMVMIPGDENNFKITTKADLERFGRIVEQGLRPEMP